MTIRVYPSRLEGEPLETHETLERLSIVEWMVSVAPEFDLDKKECHPTIRINGAIVEPSEWPLTFFEPDDAVDVYIEAKGIETAFYAFYGILMLAMFMYVKNMSVPENNKRQGNRLEDPGALANTVRWGDPIPEIAGAPRTYPDYILPPRRYYLSQTQQWVDSLVCIGMGKYQLDASQVFIGDTSAPTMGDDIEVRFFQPGEVIPEPYNDWWHTPEEVGFTTFGGAGLTLGAAKRVNTLWSFRFPDAQVPPPEEVVSGSYTFVGATITADTPVPDSWETGFSVRIEAEHPVTFEGNTIQSALLDTLEISTGDEIEVMGERDGEYIVSAILPGTGGSPGSPATATGSAAPTRLDFGSTHASLTISLAGNSYTLSLTADAASLPDLVAMMNGQLNGTPVRARVAGGFLELYQLEPFTGGAMALSGDVADLMGTPVIVSGTATAPSVGTRYVVSGANFGSGTEVTAVGRAGMLYTITDISGNVLTVTPPDVAFWVGFPDNISDATSTVQMDQSSLAGGWLGPFAAVPPGENADAFEVDIFFPGGLVHNRRSGGVRRMTVTGRIEWRYIGSNDWNLATYSYSGSSPDQMGYTRRVDLPEPGRIEVRVRTDRAPSSNPMHIDKHQWTGLRSRIVGAPTSYPGMTLCHVRIRSGDKVSGAVENKMSIRAMRILPTVEDPEVEAPTRDIAPFFIHMMNTVGYGRDLIDMPHIEALHEIWRDRGDTFDLSVNSTSTLKTVSNYCLQAGFAELTLRRGLISAARDAYRMGSPPRVYSPQELVTPLIESTESIMPDDIDGVDIEYVDYLTGRTLTESYRLIGDEGRRVEKIQAPGVSGRTQAWRLAARRRRKAAYRRTAYKGSTELSAMNSFYMDYVGLQDGIPEWGQSAFVIDHDGLVLTLSEDVQPTGGPPVVMIRRTDGTASPPIPVTVSGRRVTLPSMPPDVTVTSDPNAPTVVYIGRRTQVVHEALITEVRPSGEARVEFQAVNMDNRVYLEDDMGPDQVILTSRPYPLESIDRSRSSTGRLSVKSTRAPAPMDHSESTAVVSAIEKIRMVLYSEYHSPPDHSESTAVMTAIEKIRMVLYSEYHSPPDHSESTAAVSAIEKIRSAGYLTYADDDASESSATITTIEKVRP